MEKTWNVKELKEKGRAAFKKNYWICVLVSLILMLLAASGGSAAETSSRATAGNTYQSESTAVLSGGEADFNVFSLISSFTGIPASLVKGFLIMIGIGLIIVLAFVGLLFRIFISNPIEVGGAAFFIENSYSNPGIARIMWAFQSGNYLNIVKAMLFRDLYVFLWSLLLVIPGIVKSYEYRMVPYLLAEYPSMSRQEAFERSKQMMNGNKWNAFMLDFSFILWWMVSSVTFGIVGVFYVRPYEKATDAELYRVLSQTY